MINLTPMNTFNSSLQVIAIFFFNSVMIKYFKRNHHRFLCSVTCRYFERIKSPKRFLIKENVNGHKYENTKTHKHPSPTTH